MTTYLSAPGRRLVRLVALALPAALLLVPPVPPAVAATKDAHPEVVQCWTDFPPAGCTDFTPAGFEPVDAEISPDGKQLYVMGWDAMVLVVDRGADGTLTPRTGEGSCFDEAGSGDCTATAGLSAFEAIDLTVSADGKSVYVATGAAIASLARDPATGDLTPSSCYSPSVMACTAIPQLGITVDAVVVSPDSLNVYVRSQDRLLALDRSLTTGALTIKAGAAGCFTEAITPSCTDSVGLLADGYELALSPTGSHLYVPNVHGVAVFTRGAGGTLTQAAGTAGGCVTNDGASTVLGECESLGASGPALDQARAVTSAPSGKYVFVAGTNGSVVFARNASTGRLTMTDCVEGQAGTIPGCQNVDGANGFGVELSPDGTRAIVGGEDVAGFGVYDFDETTGHLTQLPSPEGCFSGSGAFGCTPVPGGFIGKSVWGPDGRNAYVLPDGNLLNLLQDHPPVCQSASVTVPMNAAAAIPLACTDANGEAITIQVSAPSQGGTLGAVDQATDTVVYTAKAGFSGADSFTVTATAGGRTSAPATVTVTVPPPPVSPVPPDQSVTLTIKGGKIKLNAKGKAKVALTCPATEANGPCTGNLKIKTRSKVPVGGKKKVVVLGSATYSVKAGTTKRVVVKLSAKNQKLVRQVADARKLRLVAKVKDAVGNRATTKKKATLKLP